jgi:metal-responsive CopG/Arc/MetJ family transcriptional regulator
MYINNLMATAKTRITVTLDKKVLEEMDRIFETETITSAQALIEKLYATKAKHKIVVQKNSVKAREIEKVFRKYFLLKG